MQMPSSACKRPSAHGSTQLLLLQAFPCATCVTLLVSPRGPSAPARPPAVCCPGRLWLAELAVPGLAPSERVAARRAGIRACPPPRQAHRCHGVGAGWPHPCLLSLQAAVGRCSEACGCVSFSPLSSSYGMGFIGSLKGKLNTLLLKSKIWRKENRAGIPTCAE